MGHKTLAEVLKAGQKRRDRIQRKAIKEVEDLIPPIFGPGGKVAPHVARGIVEVENALMDYAIDKLSAEAGHLQVGPPHRPVRKPFDPDNPITRFLQDLEFPGSTGPPPKKPRVRSPKQIVNDELQSVALTAVNIKARKKDGSFKKGWNQKRVMKEAQKKCTKERERLGLCKPKRKRKKQSKRNPYDSRLGLTRRRR